MADRLGEAFLFYLFLLISKYFLFLNFSETQKSDFFFVFPKSYQDCLDKSIDKRLDNVKILPRLGDARANSEPGADRTPGPWNVCSERRIGSRLGSVFSSFTNYSERPNTERLNSAEIQTQTNSDFK